MAGYNPSGKDVPEWRTEPKSPNHVPGNHPGPVNTGSQNDYNRPWSGDHEARPGTMSRVAETLQQNIGNYLLFRAVMPAKDDPGGGAVDPQSLSHNEQAAVGNAARSMLGGPAPGSKPGNANTWTDPNPPSLGSPPNPNDPKPRPHGGPPTPKGLGPGPAAASKGAPEPSTTGSAAGLGPVRSGQNPSRGIPLGIGPGANSGPSVNQQPVQSSLFSREAFDGPIQMGPRSSDRRPKGRDTRAKNRFPQDSLFDI